MNDAWSTILDIVDENVEFTDGSYVVQLVAAEPAFTARGKQKFRLTFRGTEGEHEGQTFNVDMVISPESVNAMRYFARRMDTLGADREFLKQKPSTHAVCDRIVSDRLYRVTVKNTTFAGRDLIELPSIKRL